MGQLQQIESKLVEMGFQIVAISPDPPEKLQGSIQKHQLSYRLLSDYQHKASKAFGVAYGEPSKILPVPSVFMATSEGTIRFQYVNPNYTIRIDPELMLAAARSVLTYE